MLSLSRILRELRYCRSAQRLPLLDSVRYYSSSFGLPGTRIVFSSEQNRRGAAVRIEPGTDQASINVSGCIFPSVTMTTTPNYSDGNGRNSSTSVPMVTENRACPIDDLSMDALEALAMRDLARARRANEKMCKAYCRIRAAIAILLAFIALVVYFICSPSLRAPLSSAYDETTNDVSSLPRQAYNNNNNARNDDNDNDAATTNRTATESWTVGDAGHREPNDDTSNVSSNNYIDVSDDRSEERNAKSVVSSRASFAYGGQPPPYVTQNNYFKNLHEQIQSDLRTIVRNRNPQQVRDLLAAMQG